eukprot:SAG22_NODE_2307_length_2735_cov_2.317147_1_plen_487_part_00
MRLRAGESEPAAGSSDWHHRPAKAARAGPAAMVRFLRGGSYVDGHLSCLPVRAGELGRSIEYYVKVFGLALVERADAGGDAGVPSAVLRRDDLTVGLAESGGDPEQEGAFIEVDDVDGAYAELQANGLVGTRSTATVTATVRSASAFLMHSVSAESVTLPARSMVAVGRHVSSGNRSAAALRRGPAVTFPLHSESPCPHGGCCLQSKEEPGFRLDFRPPAGGAPGFYRKVFFVVAPDGLCYCLGQQVQGAELVAADLPLMETERWALHPPVASRDAAMHELFNDDEMMLPHLAMLHNLPDDAWAVRRRQHRAGYGDLAAGKLFMDLIWKETGELVGSSGFPRPAAAYSPPAGRPDGVGVGVGGGGGDRSAEWGICVRPSHQRRGLCGEAFDACRKYAGQELGLAAITASTHRDNAVMRGFLLKKGLDELGTNADGARSFPFPFSRPRHRDGPRLACDNVIRPLSVVCASAHLLLKQLCRARTGGGQ